MGMQIEKNIVTKIGILVEQIKETYSNWCGTTSQIIKQRYFNKLKNQIADYEKLIQGFDNCSRCREFLDRSKTARCLGFSCNKEMCIYLDINICVSCGKINILKRERIGECSGKCSPCDFHMVLEFPLS